MRKLWKKKYKAIPQITPKQPTTLKEAVAKAIKENDGKIL